MLLSIHVVEGRRLRRKQCAIFSANMHASLFQPFHAYASVWTLCRPPIGWFPTSHFLALVFIPSLLPHRLAPGAKDVFARMAEPPNLGPYKTMGYHLRVPIAPRNHQSPSPALCMLRQYPHSQPCQQAFSDMVPMRLQSHPSPSAHLIQCRRAVFSSGLRYSARDL